MTKAVYVMGQHQRTLGGPERYLVCERINAPKPPALSFEIKVKKIAGVKARVPFLDYGGTAELEAWDVFQASKTERSGSGRLTSQDEAEEFVREFMAKHGADPIKTRELEDAAIAQRRYFSRSTFDRAKQAAGVRPMQTADLKEFFGREFDWMPKDDLPPRTHWVRMVGSGILGGSS